MDLVGRVALVTGASRGVGAATAMALAEAGCRVACAARATADSPQKTPGTLDDTVARISSTGGEAHAVPTDLSEPADVEAMVDETVGRFGRLDVLVNNAAVTFPGDLDVEPKYLEVIWAVNVRAPFLAIRAALPHLVADGGGAVIDVSSLAARLVVPGLMTYGMSKAALERMTVDVAAQTRDRGVWVNGFRIDVPVASEGFVANAPHLDHSSWEPSEVAAEGIVWMLRRSGPDYTGVVESMRGLREREGIMASRAERPFEMPSAD